MSGWLLLVEPAAAVAPDVPVIMPEVFEPMAAVAPDVPVIMPAVLEP